MKVFRNYSKSASSNNGIYILSAVRTPIGLLNGVLREFTALQLGSITVKEAIQRAAVPSEDIQNVFLEHVAHNNCYEEVIRRTGLSKATVITLFKTCGMKSISEASEFLHKNKDKVCIAGGMESVTNSSSANGHFFKNVINSQDVSKSNPVSMQDLHRCFEQNYKNFIKAKKNGAFCDEILKIDFRKKGQQITVAEDEILIKHEADSFSVASGDGAAAVVISTKEYYIKKNLVPLAEIISFAGGLRSSGNVSSAQLQAVEMVLQAAKCKCDEIVRWEMDSLLTGTIFKGLDSFKIDLSQVDKNGGVLPFVYPFGMSDIRAVCHLVHSLSAGELGCAVSCDFNGNASAVIIKKMGIENFVKPHLRLFTKRTCPLCDELKQQLKPFQGRFSLQEVDIEAKENEKYKELYQYEIPVLFLDGVFLCKHRLDVEHFSRRLLASEKCLM